MILIDIHPQNSFKFYLIRYFSRNYSNFEDLCRIKLKSILKNEVRLPHSRHILSCSNLLHPDHRELRSGHLFVILLLPSDPLWNPGSAYTDNACSHFIFKSRGDSKRLHDIGSSSPSNSFLHSLCKHSDEDNDDRITELISSKWIPSFRSAPYWLIT